MNENQPIRCMVIDDEPPARSVLTNYIQQVPMLHLEAEAGNAIQALAVLQRLPIDLLFLDIHMPQLNGLDFLRTLKNPPRVILTTAYPEYAIQGYELNVVDYLLKPIPFERFIRAVNKATENLHNRREPANAAEERTSSTFVYFRADRKMKKVMLNDIRYIESMKDYVKVYTREEMIISKQSISSVEAMLPDKDFIRVHRSFIVALAHIRHFSNELIGLGETEIPIGKIYRQTALKQLQG